MLRGYSKRLNCVFKASFKQPGRCYSEIQASVEDSEITQRERRGKVVADALAREEESAAQAKALFQMREDAKNLIKKLNDMPLSLARKRLEGLQASLKNMSEGTDVKELDDELADFISKYTVVPGLSDARTSVVNLGPRSSQKSSTSDDHDPKFKSTAASSLLKDFPNLKPTPDYKPYSEAELFLRQVTYMSKCGSLGSNITDIYRPNHEVTRPKHIRDVSIASLMAAGCHLGHARSQWAPVTQPFIYGEYDGIHLIDLNQTFSALKRATKIIKAVTERGGIVLYVGTSKHVEQHKALEEAASRSKGYYVSKRWIPGSITNFLEVTKQLTGDRVCELDMGDKSTGRKLLIDEQSKLVKPDLVILMNPVENSNCIKECVKLRIPTIGLCDTNMDPSQLTYPIPCNDDSMRVSSMILGVLSSSAAEGLELRLQLMNSLKAKN